VIDSGEAAQNPIKQIKFQRKQVAKAQTRHHSGETNGINKTLISTKKPPVLFSAPQVSRLPSCSESLGSP
jgi:hypothetical protein